MTVERFDLVEKLRDLAVSTPYPEREIEALFAMVFKLVLDVETAYYLTEILLSVSTTGKTVTEKDVASVMEVLDC